MPQGEVSPREGPDDPRRAFFIARTRQGTRRTRWAQAEHRSKTALANDVGPVIYAVRTRDNLIKIGHTTRLANRMRAYGGLGNLLALRPGTRDDELALHRSLAAHVHHGREYYNPTPEVIAVINGMRATHGLAPI